MIKIDKYNVTDLREGYKVDDWLQLCKR